ncbi:MAG: dihydroorotate dehydrogenase [Clostridia bacterium]|nr:dihydroorotate dehydrogenase [Clostridia bacterium]MDY4083022.1 dihydroorotate dehydrogenase [Eubacteriales bacterium]
MNLKVNIAGVEFKNPIITASGTFGFGKEYSQFYPLSALGGICTKGLTLNPKLGNPPPRIAETRSGIINSVGLQNPGIDHYLAEDDVRLASEDVVVIANVAGACLEDYIAMGEKINESKAQMVELNISCPNVKAGGMAFGILPESVERVTRAVKDVCKKPVITKLSPNVSCIADNARAAEAGGADGISLINTLSAMAINYKTRRPILYNNHGGLSGACVKPVALKMVWDCFNAVKIPIIGMGGVQSYTDVLEFMICGARAVQVGTYNFTEPMGAYNIVKDLEEYVKSQDMDINDLVGSLIVNG